MVRDLLPLIMQLLGVTPAHDDSTGSHRVGILCMIAASAMPASLFLRFERTGAGVEGNGGTGAKTDHAEQNQEQRREDQHRLGPRTVQHTYFFTNSKSQSWRMNVCRSRTKRGTESCT